FLERFDSIESIAELIDDHHSPSLELLDVIVIHGCLFLWTSRTSIGFRISVAGSVGGDPLFSAVAIPGPAPFDAMGAVYPLRHDRSILSCKLERICNKIPSWWINNEGSRAS